jgi:mannose-6-phosphate isomerase
MTGRVLVLDNPIQNYAWGSRTAIAELLGRPTPSALPEAELWLGAHPKAPSRIVEPPGLGTLDRAIARDPVPLLGREVCARFGGELPFLFKVLAAAEPLSIQAHPDSEQARAGFRRENEAGLPLDAPERNYRDANHKPELVCALTPFEALLGFRPVAEVAQRLAPLADELLTAAPRQTSSASIALRAVLQRLLTLDGAPKIALLARARREAERRAADGAWGWVARLLDRHPDDTGALAPLYLNLVSLRPGQALYLPARQLHAYLGGTALEVMASSDNVLRGGLTAKHVDAAELLATLVFEPRAPEVLEGCETGAGERVYRTPAREFELGLIEQRAGRPRRPHEGGGLEILLGLEGDTSLHTDAGSVSLARGRSALVPASLTRYEVSGSGRLARVRVPA